MSPYLTLGFIRYVSRVKWSTPEKGVAPFSTPQCSSYWKRKPLGHPRLQSPTFFTIMSLLYSFVSGSFLILQRYSFLIFSFIFTCLLGSASKVFVGFIFSECLNFSWFGSSIPSVMCRFLLFIISMVHFSLPSSIPMSWLYILTVCIRVSKPFSFFERSLKSSMYFRWLIFSCDLQSLYPAVHFFSTWLSGIIAITNSNGDSTSPWNIHLWIFASAKLFSPAVNSTLQVFMVFWRKFMTSSDILHILRQVIIQLFGDISYAFLLSIQAMARFFRLILLSLRIC